jgi:hypothetical protein
VKSGISQSITCKEDAPLPRGAGRYVADVTPAGTLLAVVLASPSVVPWKSLPPP